MTHEEATERIRCILKNNSFTRADKNALKLAIEALEKQIPKKPYWEYGGCHCKSCGLDVLSDEYFCPLCGQAIDWRMTNES